MQLCIGCNTAADYCGSVSSPTRARIRRPLRAYEAHAVEKGTRRGKRVQTSSASRIIRRSVIQHLHVVIVGSHHFETA